MKVLKFEIENYKNLAGKHELIPDGANFFLVGGNAKGKSSAGRVLIDMLTKNYPPKPVTEGEHEGYVEITFDDQSKLLAKFEDGKKPKLTFITSDGIRAATPKDFFDKMAGPGMTFNIDQFLSLAPKPKRAMLEQMVGVDLSKLNSDEAAQMEHAKQLRAELKIQQARVQPYDKSLIGEKEIDVKDLSAKIAEAKSAKKDYDRNQDDIKRGKEREKQLMQELAIVRNKIKELEALEFNLVDEFELSVMEDDLENADKKNQEIRQAETMAKEEEKTKLLEKSLKATEKKITLIREAKEDEIRSKPLPAEGLEFDPNGDGLLLNGHPFEGNHVSSSEKAIAAIQIAEAQLGKIKYLHFDAAFLDKDNAMKVLEWVEGKDLQLCVERPIWDGKEELRMEIYDKTGQVVKEAKV